MKADKEKKESKTRQVKVDPRWFGALEMYEKMNAKTAEIAVVYDVAVPTICNWLNKARELREGQPYGEISHEMYKKRLADLTPKAISTYQKLAGGKTNASLSASRDILTDQDILLPKTEVKSMRDLSNDQLAEIISKAFFGTKDANKSESVD